MTAGPIFLARRPEMDSEDRVLSWAERPWGKRRERTTAETSVNRNIMDTLFSVVGLEV
jgi:hypothetical protein